MLQRSVGNRNCNELFSNDADYSWPSISFHRITATTLNLERIYFNQLHAVFMQKNSLQFPLPTAIFHKYYLLQKLHSSNVFTERRRTAVLERISGVSLDASAGWHVIDDLAIGVLTAHTRARILALRPHAVEMRRTVGTEHALGSTSVVRVSNVVGHAAAGSYSVLLATESVGSAW